MLRKLIEFALAQRMVTVLAALLIVIGGGVALQQLPIDAFPDISPTQVKLILKAPGMTPEEVETRVIVPLEMELLGIPKQTLLRASAKYAIADVTLDFVDGTDIYWARQQVAERFNNVMPQLPQGVSGGLAPIATPLSDMLMFTIEGGALDLEQRRTLLDWVIRPALRTLPGVADVNALGGRVRTYEVVPDRARMASAHLSLNELRQAIENNNGNDGAGRLNDGEEALLVRTTGAITTLEDVGNIVIASHLGRVTRIADVAEVRHGSLTRYGAVTQSGRGEAVEGLVIGLRGADASKLVKSVQSRLQELQPSLPQGVRVDVFYNRSDLIQRAVATVRDALFEATVLVVLLLLVFLGDVRAALVVAVTLPMAALLTFMLMHVFGMSANLMSLGGLAIAIGMLVDAAVVVVENAASRLAHPQPGVPKLHVIYRATTEVATPVASGIVIICLVFLPLLTLEGLEGKLFAPVALTIVFALSASLLLSLTLIPVLAAALLKSGQHDDPALMRWLMPRYDRALRMALTHPKHLVGAAVVAMVTAGIAYLFVGKTFMPTMDEGAVLVQLEKLPSVNLERSIEEDLRIQQAILKAVPEVTRIVARAGADELGFDPMSLNQTDSFLVLKPAKQWRPGGKAALTEHIRLVLQQFPGVNFAFTQPIEMRVAEMLTGTRGDLAVKLFGPDLHVLGELTQAIEAKLKEIKGSEDVYTLTNEGVQYLQVDADRLALGRAGLDIATLQTELRAQVEGLTVGQVLEQGRRIPLTLRGDETLRNEPQRLADLTLALPDGGTARIGDLATVTRVDGPVKVDRENASRYAIVQANVSGRDLVGYVEEAKARVASSIALPSGYHLVWGGQFENQQRAAARLTLVVPLALGLIFLVLFATFGSARQAGLILMNIPFALVGGVLALALTGEYLSVPAAVGFIALLGIAVLNGLVMVSHFNHLRDTGLPMQEVVLEGAKRRLRPVMMTASITALGLLPLLLATGPGSEIQRPLAIVVMGGLATSTLLTLLLLPLLYRRFGTDLTAVERVS